MIEIAENLEYYSPESPLVVMLEGSSADYNQLSGLSTLGGSMKPIEKTKDLMEQFGVDIEFVRMSKFKRRHKQMGCKLSAIVLSATGMSGTLRWYQRKTQILNH